MPLGVKWDSVEDFRWCNDWPPEWQLHGNPCRLPWWLWNWAE